MTSCHFLPWHELPKGSKAEASSIRATLERASCALFYLHFYLSNLRLMFKNYQPGGVLSPGWWRKKISRITFHHPADDEKK
jgi:hypothetical protein